MLWRLLFRCAMYEIDAEDVVRLFFEDEVTMRILQNSNLGYTDALSKSFHFILFCFRRNSDGRSPEYKSDIDALPYLDVNRLIPFDVPSGSSSNPSTSMPKAASSAAAASGATAPATTDPSANPSTPAGTKARSSKGKGVAVTPAPATGDSSTAADTDDDEPPSPTKRGKAKAEAVPFTTKTRRATGTKVRPPAPFVLAYQAAAAASKAKSATKVVRKPKSGAKGVDGKERIWENDFLRIFKLPSPLARGEPPEGERVEQLKSEGRKLDMEAERPVSGQSRAPASTDGLPDRRHSLFQDILPRRERG
jgi:hypothetical protein